MTNYLIRRGRRDEARCLQDVERAAGKLFIAVGMPEIAADEPTTVAHFEARARQGRLLVVMPEGDDRPVGFLYWSNHDGCAYTEEVAVHPAHAGSRLGARLLDALASESGGIKTLTLATFRDVPWNAPYYARLGFAECDCAELGPGHEAEWRKQADHGLDMTKRVFMRRSIK